MKTVFLDFECRGLKLPKGESVDNFILGYGICVDGTTSSYQWHPEVSRVHLQELCDNTHLVFFNATYEIYILERLLGLHVKYYDDVALIAYTWHPDAPLHKGSRHSLDAWASRLGLGNKLDPGIKDWSTASWTPSMASYCEQDCLLTSKVWDALQPQLASDVTAYNFYKGVSLPFVRSIVEMEANGLRFDRKKLEEFTEARKKRCSELLEEIRAIVPKAPGKKVTSFNEKTDTEKYTFVCTEEVEDTRKKAEPGSMRTQYLYKTWEPFNPGSSIQIAWALKELYQWEPTEFTETGAPSCGSEILEALDYPLAELLAEYSGEMKLVSSFGDTILEKMDEEGRVYPSYNNTATATGRLSCNSPNLQQLPRPSESYAGLQYRECIIPSEGKVFVGCDMGGFQLKILAFYLALLAKNTAFLDKLNEGVDAHTATGQLIGQSRQVGKGVNLIY